MRIVFTSYVSSPQFTNPDEWLERINGHTGILEELAKIHEVISIERINFEGAIERNRVQYYFVRLAGRKTYLPIKLHQTIKKLKPDVVFINGLIFPFQLIQLKYFFGGKIKIIVQNHAEKPFNGWRKFLQRQADRHIKTYFFTSKEMGLEWVTKKIISSEEKIVEVMEASSSFQRIEKTLARAITNCSGAPIFLWVGRLDANKDPVTVVKAFLKFIKYNPLARLYMIFHTEELLEKIKELITPVQNIILTGRLPHKDLQAWYNSADFIISGSHYEGSGVAVCEAMSCGCIPIVTNIASFRKMTGRGNCGFLYEAGNSEQLLSILLRTPEMDLISEKKKTLRQFSEELSFETIASQINKVIHSVSGKPLLPN
jgi:glycosyltransferase involved in cell wall biosynthesis